MKKVLMGILVLIPVLIMVIVALVSLLIAVSTHIGVTDITITLNENYKDGFIDLTDDVYKLFDKNDRANSIFNVSISPSRATDQTVTWTISNVEPLDDSYTGELPAAMLVADNKTDYVQSNTTGYLRVNAYCIFTVTARAETKSATATLVVGGYKVQKVYVSNPGGGDTLAIGNSVMLEAQLQPMDSLIDSLVWTSSNPETVSVDKNGVVTALGEGEAVITATAKGNYDDGEITVAGEMTIKSTKTGSVSRYGDKIYISAGSFNYVEYGVSSPEAGEGYTISGNMIVLGAGVQSATVKTANGNLTVIKCADNDVKIVNGEFYGYDAATESGYVLATGELPLYLTADWLISAGKANAPEVEWTSSNPDAATVDQNGVVTAVGGGETVISVSLKTGGAADGYSELASVLVKVAQKVSYITTELNSESMKKGLAEETIYASSVYDWSAVGGNFGDHDNWKDKNFARKNNSVVINIDRPQQPSDADALARFLKDYTFKVETDGGLAYFESENSNVVYFDYEKIAAFGKQKVQITVSVEAKYPKYESSKKYTKREITFTVVNGVSIDSDIDAPENLRDVPEDATEDEKEEIDEYNEAIKHEAAVERYRRITHASAEMQYIYYEICGGTREVVSDHDYHEKNKSALKYYYEKSEEHPDGDYKFFAAVLDGDVAFSAPRDNSDYGGGESILLRGNLYGNGYQIRGADKEQGHTYEWDGTELVKMLGTNLTVSNVTLSANYNIGDSLNNKEEEGIEQASGFKGESLDFMYAERSESYVRAENSVVEYCVLENAKTLLNNDNSDIYINGSIFRNSSGAAIYSCIRADEMDLNGDGEKELCFRYNNIHFNNSVMSNMLGTAGSFEYRHFGVYYDEKKKAITRENWEQEILPRLQSEGMTGSLTVTGFLDIYNWQDTRNVGAIFDGIGSSIEDFLEELIKSAAATAISKEERFAPYRIQSDENNFFVHMGFVISGISEFPSYEPTYLVVNEGENRLGRVNLGGLSLISSMPIANTLGSVDVLMYRNNDSKILPDTPKYQINQELINKLHGRV